MNQFIYNLEAILKNYYDYSLETKEHYFSSYNADWIFQKESIIYQYEHKIIDEATMFKKINALGDDDCVYDIHLDYNNIDFEKIAILKHIPNQLMLYLLDDGDYKYLIKANIVVNVEERDEYSDFMDQFTQNGFVGDDHCFYPSVGNQFEVHTEAIDASNFQTIYDILPSMKHYTKAFDGVKTLFDASVEKLSLESTLQISIDNNVNGRKTRKI
jgi:hypothetical protein